MHEGLPIQQLVLQSTWEVTERSYFVAIRQEKLEEFAAVVGSQVDHPPKWDLEHHYADGTDKTAQWVLVLDALNFSFWPDGEQERWRVPCHGGMVEGYYALAHSLKRAVEIGEPITDAAFLREVNVADVKRVLDGEGVVPMLEERVAVLKEIGRVLEQRYGGSFANLLRKTGRSAAETVKLVVESFPCFNDVASFEGETIYFFKRAQILVSDLWGAFAGTGLGNFRDLSTLTAFADYKLPQLLRAVGVLEYSPPLARLVDNLIEVAAGSREEVEIRAATVQAVERIRRCLLTAGRQVDAFAIDWWLWDLSHAPDYEKLPHHRTRTIFY